MWPMPLDFGRNPFLDATAGGMLAAVAERFSEREAIVVADRRITYAELYQGVNRCAPALLATGVKRGHTVALWLPNRPEWFFIQYACAMLGAVAVSLNTRYKAHELGYILEQSEATTLILTDRLGPVDYLDTLHAVVPGLFDAEPGDLAAENFPHLKRIIVDCEDPHPGCLGLRDLGEAAENDTWQWRVDDVAKAVGPDDPWMILYTSGTTSFPKGALISHRNAVPHGWYAGKVLGVTETDRVLHALPLTGTWGGLCIPLSTFTHGGCLVLMETFDPALALHLIERDGLFEDIVHTLGVPQAYQPYGMTELNALCLLHYLEESEASRAISGVWPAEGIEVRVVDPETGEDMPVGRQGELWFRGPLVTRGYYKKPEETAKAFSPDGWFKTGDLAVRDAEGRTIFKGRLREALRISHFMVAPAEIEAFIMTHPLVSQAFVIGVPDPKLNEAPVAFVIPREGEPLTEAEVIAHCKGKIASFKIPRHVRIVADVPRTPGPHGDKVQKAKLRELFLTEPS